jgi:hypothetical protein
MNIVIDARMSDEQRRAALYAGSVFVYSPRKASLDLCEFARQLIREAFPGLDPELAQRDMPVEQYASILEQLKPKFIHHPESKRLLRELLSDIGCDPATTYFDVPRMRTSTSDGYLTTGISYAFHPHRDTWYSAPLCQVNWWMPIYDVAANNVMAFHPQYWDRSISNTSAVYDYQRWTQTSRFNAAQHIGKDTRVQPHAEVQVAMVPDMRVVMPVGGLMMFSAAQLHSSVPNTSGRTRFSIDFRTANVEDALAARGAANRDSRCTGTALTDFLRVSDLEHVPQNVLDLYMPGHPQTVVEA